jgi:hypothetical protein
MLSDDKIIAEKHWVICGRRKSWPILKYYPMILIEVRNSIAPHPELESAVLTAELHSCIWEQCNSFNHFILSFSSFQFLAFLQFLFFLFYYHLSLFF